MFRYAKSLRKYAGKTSEFMERETHAISFSVIKLQIKRRIIHVLKSHIMKMYEEVGIKLNFPPLS
jgi:hypothetical protein